MEAILTDAVALYRANLFRDSFQPLNMGEMSYRCRYRTNEDSVRCQALSLVQQPSEKSLAGVSEKSMGARKMGWWLME